MQPRSSSKDIRSASELRGGRLVLQYEAIHDVVTLAYVNLTLEDEADVRWFEQECVAFWQRFHKAQRSEARKDILVDMDGIVVKAAAAPAWNAVRGRMAEKYLAKTYRFGGERRTVTAVHLGQVLNRVDGIIHADRQQALAALLADRQAAKRG